LVNDRKEKTTENKKKEGRIEEGPKKFGGVQKRKSPSQFRVRIHSLLTTNKKKWGGQGKKKNAQKDAEEVFGGPRSC